MRTVQFGGYFACPLKGLYLQPVEREGVGVFRQLKEIGEREGIKVQALLLRQGLVEQPESCKESDGLIQDGCCSPWAQDDKVIFRDIAGQEKVGLFGAEITSDAEKFSKWTGHVLQGLTSKNQGGNVFLGRDKPGNPFALVGSFGITDSLELIRKHLIWQLLVEGLGHFKQDFLRSSAALPVLRTQAKKIFAEEVDIADHRRVWEVPQPDFHLDMAIRPLKYPNILVHDLRLTLALVERALTESPDAEERRKLSIARELVVNEMALPRNFAKPKDPDIPYASRGKVTAILRNKGFATVLAPGVIRGNTIHGRYGKLLSLVPGSEEITPTNFLNAVVHQRANGRLLYITNASPFPTLDQIFARWLQKTCPEVEQVEFISGSISPDGKQDIAYFLQRNGGIHCLTLEAPDFERWSRMA